MTMEPLTNKEADQAPYKILLYYKLAPIADPQQFAKEHREFCVKHNLKGRILIAAEGLNGTCAGLPQDADAYMAFVHSLPGFEDTWFKQQYITNQPLRRLHIRVKKEVVALGEDGLDQYEGGIHLSPEQVNVMYEQAQHDDAVVFFDMRSEIEAKVGRFPNAIVPKIRFFRELPQQMVQYEHLKDKKIVMYCTGGVRCEKASKLFRKHGFKDIYEVDGGIYNYCTQFPDGNFKGSCYVFDDRMQVVFDKDGKIELPDHAPAEKIISQCDFCGTSSARVVNDERKAGRVLVVCCQDCDTKHDISRIRYKKRTPSTLDSKQVPSQTAPQKTYLGKGQHYYPRPQVAQIIIEQGQLTAGDQILIEGPTTGSVRMTIPSLKIDLRDDSTARPGDIITFPSPHIIRSSDRIYKITSHI